MVTLALTPALSPDTVAVSVYVPTVLTRQLEKVATPEEVERGLLEQVSVAPPAGAVIARVTFADEAVRVLPPASWMATRGWTAKDVLRAVTADGSVMKASRTAGPTLIVREALTPAVRPGEVAVSVYVPALSIWQPAKVATPATAATGLAVQARVAPAGVVMAKVSAAVLEVIVFTPASWMLTRGWVAKSAPPVDPDGLVVKTSRAGAPAVMVKLVLVAELSPDPVAVSV
jgi:hypothetical protein